MSKKWKLRNFYSEIKEIANGFIVEPQEFGDARKRVFYPSLEEAVKAAKTELTRFLIVNGRGRKA